MPIEDACFLSPHTLIRFELPQRIPGKGVGHLQVDDGLGIIYGVKLSLHG
jgi:hypothetical protein